MTVLRQDPKGSETVAIVHKMLDRNRNNCCKSNGHHPIVVLEGLDGVGKSTLAQNLMHSLSKESSAKVLKTPPEELYHLRSHFDKQSVELRRAYYSLGNYACALCISNDVRQGPIIVDRFWPSTIAYTVAQMQEEPMPDERQELFQMPIDLLDLLPSNPIVYILLELSSDERARRVRTRAMDGPAVTEEESALERSRQMRDRVSAGYRDVSVGGERLIVCDASGTPEEVHARAMRIIKDVMTHHQSLTPVSVNWHYLRTCNYACKFCFHTAKTSFFLPKEVGGLAEAKRCLKKLSEAGMRKMNFSGGEPFLQPRELGQLCQFCKEDLQLENVSIVSNGSKITKEWLRKFGQYVDILAISCDSFIEEKNVQIGRGKGMHVKQLKQVRAWCDQYNVSFKVNSVICTYNVDEDMHDAIAELKPVRWKVFQCLLLDGENTGATALRNAEDLTITKHQFNDFLERHRDIHCMVPESNEEMKDSYLILNEYLCFLNCTGGAKTPSRSIRDVTVRCALKEAGFDSAMFEKRGGRYEWSRPKPAPKSQPPADIEDLSITRSEKLILKQLRGSCKSSTQIECTESRRMSSFYSGALVCLFAMGITGLAASRMRKC